MAVGQKSTFIKSFQAGIFSAIPAWLEAMFFGQPIAHSLYFKKDQTTLILSGGQILVPEGWISEPSKTAVSKRAKLVDVFLPKAFFLHRTLNVPTKSLAKADKVVALDTLQKTPFKESQIFFTFRLGDKGGNTTKIDQWIAKRDDVLGVGRNLAEYGFEARRFFVEDVRSSPIADLSKTVSPSTKYWQRANALLIIVIMLVGISLWARPNYETYVALEAKTQQLNELRVQALELRERLNSFSDGSAERTALLDRITNRPLMTAVLRDITVALPDTVWVSDFLFQQDRVVLSASIQGSAAELVLELTRNRQFENARLVGPISQTAEGRERFDLMLDLSGGRN